MICEDRISKVQYPRISPRIVDSGVKAFLTIAYSQRKAVVFETVARAALQLGASAVKEVVFLPVLPHVAQ